MFFIIIIIFFFGLDKLTPELTPTTNLFGWKALVIAQTQPLLW